MNRFSFSIGKNRQDIQQRYTNLGAEYLGTIQSLLSLPICVSDGCNENFKHFKNIIKISQSFFLASLIID